jgi:hypothetical protein
MRDVTKSPQHLASPQVSANTQILYEKLQE